MEENRNSAISVRNVCIDIRVKDRLQLKKNLLQK